jgi:(E)-4-hydroxy-3-methylbut-2-enyl-diphosphate synthase
MRIKRRKTRSIKIGSLYIGSSSPVAIQSMTKTFTKDVQDTLKQIKILEKVGCEIVRLAVKDFQDARAIKKIKRFSKIPLVADIHFDWRLAILAIEHGIDKIRLNPGNIHKREDLKKIIDAAKDADIPIRIGANSGSLKGLKQGAGKTRNISQIMVKEVMNYLKTFEGVGFYNLVISLKASNIFDTVDAYRKMSQLCDYPFHLGLTASGAPPEGMVKSSMAIGALLLEGIGDTIRVSLTEKPEAEVRVAKSILENLGLRHFGPKIISCPTCGRCEVNLIRVVKDLDKKLSSLNCKLKNNRSTIAVMGCIVNGPGEASEADIGIAFGKKEGLLFKKGKPLRKVKYKNSVSALTKELN